MKTIGVLGLGAQAAVDFQVRVHEVAQRVIPARGTSGYPPMIVYYHRRAPVAVKEDLLPFIPLRADPELLVAAKWLGAKVDFLVMTANGPHLCQKEIEEASGRPILSMIEATIGEVQRRGWRRIGVLGYYDANVPVYTGPMRERGLVCETIDPARQPGLNQAVLGLMEGRETEESRGVVRDAVAELRGRGVDGIIPGCTEMPLLLGEAMKADDLVDPAQMLAEAAVRLVCAAA